MMFDLGDAMVKLSDKIQSIVFTSPTSASIWWENGHIGHYTGKEDEIARLREFQRMMNEFDQKWQQDHLERINTDGPYYADADRAKAKEDYEDYCKQRQMLRDQGLYGHVADIGSRYHYRIVRPDGTEGGSGAMTITAEDVAGVPHKL